MDTAGSGPKRLGPNRPSAEIWLDIEKIANSVHPLELLCQLSIFLLRFVDKPLDTEEFAKWQVRLELLAWHYLRSPIGDYSEILVDANILDPLTEACDEYFNAVTFEVIAQGVGNEVADMAELMTFIKLEALHVRGEGFPSQIKKFARGVYGQHNDWFSDNLGFTIDDAIVVCETAFELLAEKLKEHFRLASKVAQENRALYSRLLEVDPTSLDVSQRALREAVASVGLDLFADKEKSFLSFSMLRDVLRFSVLDLKSKIGEACGGRRIEACLARMSQELGVIEDPVEPQGLNPLAARPFIVHEGSYYLPVSPLVYEALLSTFHYDLLGDAKYRKEYDSHRSEWLENEAMASFSRIFGEDAVYKRLKYGPKSTGYEIDGLIVYDDKLILVECKWKSLTLEARAGDYDRMRTDVSKSIAEAYSQARRARTFITESSSPAEFTDETGMVVYVDPNSIHEVYEISLLGRGAFAVLAANLPRFAPRGLFNPGEYPWAISIIDLSLACELLEFPSQFFHYVKLRKQLVDNDRIVIHDEWDILGLYFDGHLASTFDAPPDVHTLMVGKSDAKIDEFVSALSEGRNDVKKPRREMGGWPSYFDEIEQSQMPYRSDFVIALLNMPDEFLRSTWEEISTMLDLTRSDRQMHSLFFQHRDFGLTVVSTSGEPDRMSGTVRTYCLLRKYRSKLQTCLALGIDVQVGSPPHVIGLLDHPWMFDSDLERAANENLGQL